MLPVKGKTEVVVMLALPEFCSQPYKVRHKHMDFSVQMLCQAIAGYYSASSTDYRMKHPYHSVFLCLLTKLMILGPPSFLITGFIL